MNSLEISGSILVDSKAEIYYVFRILGAEILGSGCLDRQSIDWIHRIGRRKMRKLKSSTFPLSDRADSSKSATQRLHLP